MIGERDMFGFVPPAPEAPAMTTAERKRMKRRAAEVARGYAAKPGTGPEGETCKSCQHNATVRQSKTFHKCALNKAAWAKSRRTDILVSSPACSKWERSA